MWPIEQAYKEAAKLQFSLSRVCVIPLPCGMFAVWPFPYVGLPTKPAIITDAFHLGMIVRDVEAEISARILQAREEWIQRQEEAKPASKDASVASVDDLFE